MSNVLQQIAALHRERYAKAEKIRLLYERKVKLEQAYFSDSGIPEMWADVKDIKIPNKMPATLAGLTITIGDLLDRENAKFISNTGIALQWKNGTTAQWYVEDNSARNDEKTELIYYVFTPRKHLRLAATEKDSRKKFVNSFVHWLAKLVTPAMLAEMDIPMEAPSVVKRSRKILQLAET